VQIRRLTEQDAQSLWQFRRFALETDPWAFAESPEELLKTSVEDYAKRLSTGAAENFVIGAFHQDTLVGTVGFYQDTLLKRRHKGTIWGVFVHPSARGQGLGRTLMLRAIETAKTLPGLSQILLTVSVSQPAARALYVSCGFKPIGIEPRGLKIGARAVDEEHMVLDLT
jgi:ribosomal protein S18 acetylase RimI-like enzyme